MGSEGGSRRVKMEGGWVFGVVWMVREELFRAEVNHNELYGVNDGREYGLQRLCKKMNNESNYK